MPPHRSTVSPHSVIPPALLAQGLLWGGGCGNTAGSRELTGNSCFPASATLATCCGTPPPPAWPQGEEGIKKKKGKCWFCFGWGAGATRNVGKPQLGLPCSSARHGALARRHKGLLPPCLAETEHKAQSWPTGALGKRDRCGEVAVDRQGGVARSRWQIGLCGRRNPCRWHWESITLPAL